MDEDQDDLTVLMDVAKFIAKSADASKKAASTTAFAIQESYKEKLAQMREIRTGRFQELQLPHRHICDMVAMYLGIEPQDVLEAAADDDKHIELLESFLSKGGTKAILFYYQDGPSYELDTGRSNPNAVADAVYHRIYITNGEDYNIKQLAIAVYKITDVDISLKNINDVVYFTKFDIEFENGNPVAISYKLLSDLLEPSFKHNKDWGDLSKTEVGLRQKVNFQGDFDAFVEFLKQTRLDLEMVIEFKYDRNLYRKEILNEKRRQEAILTPKIVQRVETIVRLWCKQMERALVQYQQIRSENEFVGPLVEIEYWRRQLSRFTSIVEFLCESPCKSHINFLQSCKSKLLKVWTKHETQVIEAKNECTDNMRYLYALEKFCDPLYRCEAIELMKHIPPLLHAIRMIFSTSRYYNNTANVTSILVKVSNQMINVCRAYLNCHGTKTVWNQKKIIVLEKIKVNIYFNHF